jgi:beta-lactamase regulating signal transducer with metallopeptidase domain
MIELLLKASFVSGIALLFYKIVLQQESFFAANRLYLLGAIAIAFVLPLITLPPLVSHQGVLSTVFQTIIPAATPSSETAVAAPAYRAPVSPANQDKYTVLKHPAHSPIRIEEAAKKPESQATTGKFSWSFWLIVLYLFGVIVFTCNLLFQIGSILGKVIRSIDKVNDGRCVIVNTESMQAPCSFFRYIFIHPDDYDYETYEQIIAHEKIHVHQRHSIDLLIAELAVIFLWFNPLIWLLKKEIEKNIEYQTDAILLREGVVSKNQYQLSLVQIAAPHKPLTITTNYNQSLLKQRILMMNAKKSTLHDYWKYAFLAPLFFGTLLLLNEPVISRTMPSIITSNEEPEPVPAHHTTAASMSVKKAKEQVKATVATTSEEDMSRGYWYSHQEAAAYCIELRGNQDASRWHWNVSKCFAKALFEKKATDVFQLTRETGTLVLTGKLDEEVSQGKYVFTQDDTFEKYLAKNNISHPDKNFIFHLYLADVNRKYVDFLKQQYKEVNGERLMEVAIHGISMTDYQAYLNLFKKYSNTTPSMEEVIDARIHGITEAYVQEMQAMGFTNLSLDKMMDTRIHGVDGKYIDGLKKAGFNNLTIDEILDAKIHGITPASIREIQALGLGELSLDKMMDVQIHGVTAAYIEELKTAGFKNLSLDKIVEAKIHGMNASSIKEIQALGFANLSLDKMIEIKIHGVTATYIKDLQTAGFDKLTLDQVMEAKIHGITATFVKEIQALGFGKLSLDKLTEMKIHGVNVAYIEELKKAGFKDLDLDKIIEARIHGVNAEFIKEANQKGYNLKSIDDYIELKIFGMARRSK